MEQQTGLDQISPEQFAEMVSEASDEEIVAAVKSVGTEKSLDRIFEGMKDRFSPDKAHGVDAKIQFVVTDDGDEHPYMVTIANGSCTAERGRAEHPKVTLTADVANFAKLVTGNAQGPQLFMAGMLKVSGDIFFSAKITSFFEMPKK